MKRDFEWYRSNGFDEQTARYFADGPRTIRTVSPGPDFTLSLVFDNGECRILDCKPHFVPGSLFNALCSKEAFSRVFLDENGNPAWDIAPNVDSGVHWDNRIDICKDVCYLKSVPASSESCRDSDLATTCVAEAPTEYDAGAKPAVSPSGDAPTSP